MKNRAPQETSPLDNLSIASPCKADWAAMAGDSRKRFCGDCRKNVYNLSAMTRAEAEAVLLTGGSHGPCVRYFQRKDGTVLTTDCPVGVRFAEKARQRTAAAFATVLAFMGNVLGIARAQENVKPYRLMGGAPPPRQLLLSPTPKTSEPLTGNIKPPKKPKTEKPK